MAETCPVIKETVDKAIEMQKARIEFGEKINKIVEDLSKATLGQIPSYVDYEDIDDLGRGLDNLEWLKKHIEEVGCGEYLAEVKGAKIMESLGQPPGIWYRYLDRLRRIYGKT